MAEVALRTSHGVANCSLARPSSEWTFDERLQQFEELIRNVTLQDTDVPAEERRHLITENLHFDDFHDSIRKLFSDDVKTRDIQAIFQKIRINPDAKVDWSELFGYHDNGDQGNPLTLNLDGGRVFAVAQRRRIGDAAGNRKRRDVAIVINFIVPLDCYVTVSQKGALSVWTTKRFRLQSCIDVCDKSWVTTGDYLPNIRRMAICQERSISLVDVRATGMEQQQRFIVRPLESSIQCSVSIPYNGNSHRDSLLYGDDEGFVGLLTIDANDLSNNKNNLSRQRTTTDITLDPNKLSSPRYRRKLHNGWVSKVKYFPQLRCFGSCSADSSGSFYLDCVEALTDEREVKGFSLSKGVNAFDFCAKANLIATGGVDRVIRVWHPNIFTAPVGKLIGHLFTIIDLVINQTDQHIISLSSARVIRVWDIASMAILQIFMDNDETAGEKKIYSIFYNEKYEHLITGSSVLKLWPLTRTIQDQLQIPHSHDRPIRRMLLNLMLSQLVTVCSESIIRTWDIQIGRLLHSVPSGHGTDPATAEINALAIDPTGYRLASGASDGSVKVWDAGSLQELKWRQGSCSNGRYTAPEDDANAVVSLWYCVFDCTRCIVVVTSGNCVRILDDSKTSRDLPTLKVLNLSTILPPDHQSPSLALPPISLNASVLSHGHTMTTATAQQPEKYELTSADLLVTDSDQILAVGSSNGSVLLWNVTQMQIENIAQIPDTERSKMKTTPSFSSSRRKSTDTRSGTITRGIRRTVQSIRFLSRPRKNQGLRPETDNHQPKHIDSASATVKLHFKDEVDEQKAESETKDSFASLPLRPEAKAFDPVIVTCHSDATICFWDQQGCLLGDVLSSRGSKVTACTSDLLCRRLYTADSKGYVTVWKMEEFLEEMEDLDRVEQVLSWRAHLTRVVQMVYVDESEVLFTASIDCSVRVWYASTGTYLGYFGQPQQFDLRPPLSDPAPNTLSAPLPYDITEVPQSPERRIRESVRIQEREEARHLVEYPLVFDAQRWIPFRRSAYLKNRGVGRISSNLVASSNRKFFEALKKSSPRKRFVDSYVTGDVGRGAIYRALPVYRIKTPVRVKTPDLCLRKLDYCSSFDRMPTVTILDENSGDPGQCVSSDRSPQQNKLRRKKRSSDDLSHREYFAHN